MDRIYWVQSQHSTKTHATATHPSQSRLTLCGSVLTGTVLATRYGTRCLDCTSILRSALEPPADNPIRVKVEIAYTTDADVNLPANLSRLLGYLERTGTFSGVKRDGVFSRSATAPTARILGIQTLQPEDLTDSSGAEDEDEDDEDVTEDVDVDGDEDEGPFGHGDGAL